MHTPTADAGCDAWYSVFAGTVAAPLVSIVRAARDGDPLRAVAESDRLKPLWDLFAEHGSLRVTAAVAEQLGLAQRSCLPRPLLGLSDHERDAVARVIGILGLS